MLGQQETTEMFRKLHFSLVFFILFQSKFPHHTIKGLILMGWYVTGNHGLLLYGAA